MFGQVYSSRTKHITANWMTKHRQTTMMLNIMSPTPESSKLFTLKGRNSWNKYFLAQDILQFKMNQKPSSRRPTSTGALFLRKHSSTNLFFNNIVHHESGSEYASKTWALAHVNTWNHPQAQNRDSPKSRPPYASMGSPTNLIWFFFTKEWSMLFQN